MSLLVLFSAPEKENRHQGKTLQNLLVLFEKNTLPKGGKPSAGRESLQIICSLYKEQTIL
jgi:hypothetical protein